MKMFPESSLPLKAQSLAERYVLYSVENSTKLLSVSALCAAGCCWAWWFTGLAFFGVIAAINLVHLVNGWQAKVLMRIIQRTSDKADTNIA